MWCTSDLKEYPCESIGKCRYAVCYVDDASRRGIAYPLIKKSDTAAAFTRYLNEECAPRGYTVEILRSDNGGEYIGHEMVTVCLTHYNDRHSGKSIEQEFSSPHCQSGNGVAEVFWRETSKIIRAILWDQQRHHKYWAAALHFAYTIRNHLLTILQSTADHPKVCG